MNEHYRPRKRFGQHFLTDSGVINDIVAAIAARPDDVLVEIGPGTGAITRPLAATGAELHLVEFDRDLVAALRSEFAHADNVHVHEADALSFDFGSLGRDLRIVGNLPYNISTPLLFHLIDYRDHIRDMHFMLQKEVVDRMSAVPGSKRYGRLTIMLGCYMEVMPLFDVSPDAFNPPPKVTSSVVALRPLPADAVTVSDAAGLSRLLARAFAQRRKTVRNALKQIANSSQLESAGIDPGWRPENVPIDSWIRLADVLRVVL